MSKKEIPGLVKLVLFVYKKYYQGIGLSWHVYSLGILNILSQILPVISSYVLSLILDGVISISQNGGNITDLTSILRTFAIVAISNSLISYAYGYVDAIQNMWLSYLNDRAVYSKYLSIEPKAFEDPDFAKQKSLLEWNMGKMTNTTYEVLEIGGIFAGVIVAMLSVSSFNWIFFVLILLGVIPSSIITAKFGKKVWSIWGDKGEEKIKYATYRWLLEDASYERFQEMYVFGYGPLLLKRAMGINGKFNRRLEKNHTKRFLWLGLSGIWNDLIYILIIIVSIKSVLEGNLTVGMLGFTISTYKNMNWSFSKFVNRISSVISNKKILETFYKVQNYENNLMGGDIKLQEYNNGISIEFKNVSFKYPGSDKWVLENISFEVDKDEDIALVGKNGAGKSTIIKLILRIYDPQKGEIFVNGINVKDLDLKSYYRKIGVLSQSFNQMRVTVRDNILVGDINRKDRKGVKEVAKMAEIHEDIEKLDNKYDTYLNKEIKGGTEFSGGQWQKLAIARVFYRRSKLLILDEPTSAVDAIAEERIFDNIRKNAKGQTAVIVSHRFATVRKARRILVIDEGKVVEDGDHKELMSKDGLYKEMYSKQVDGK